MEPSLATTGSASKHASRNPLRTWQGVHKWSSLICTLFLLVICVTGLPLVFGDEIEALLDPPQAYPTLPADTPHKSLDQLMDTAKHMYPGQIVTSIFADDDEPQVYVWMAPSFEARKADPKVGHFVRFDARTGRVIELSKPPKERGLTFLGLMLKLHVNLFAGLPGEMFMAVMGLIFISAIVSGVALYGPFTRKLHFGEMRIGRSRRVRWLDLHNLLGMVTLAWALVVGATGVMNELSTPLFAVWRDTDVKEMLAPWRGKSPPQANELSSPQRALETASHALPGMVVTSITFPGAPTGSPHHYLLWAQGKTPLTKRLSSPVLIDARTGKLAAVIKMPWYLRALEVSRPLHFGDYGGMPLKIIWALLDLVTILVLGSGLYLWIGKRNRAPAGTTRQPYEAGSSVYQLEAAE